MYKVGDKLTYNNKEYELLENNIIPQKKKYKFMLLLNLYAIIVMVVGIGLTFIIIPGGIAFDGTLFELGLMLVVLLIVFTVFVGVHELLHGITFKIFNKNKLEDLKFGIVLKSGAAYCISLVPVKVWAARLSLMMPVYVICLPLYIYGVIYGNIMIGIIAVGFFSGSVGDFYYMWKLRSSSKEHYMFEEMPTKTGYEIGYLLLKKLN